MRRLPLPVAFALAALVLVPSALADGNGGFNLPAPASPDADRIGDLYEFVAVFAILIFLLVTVPLVVFVSRYRGRGRGRDVEGSQIRGNTRLEILWTIVPTLIIAAIAAFTFYKLPGITTEEAKATDKLVVKVEGRRFYWRYVYPNGAVSVDRLRVPLGRVVELELAAPASDVVHSYWVPTLGGKRDALPGQTTRTQFRPEKLGLHKGVCGEFCGIQHAAMLASVEVLPPERYEAWVAERREDLEADGRDLGAEQWQGVCSKCHRLGGELLVGPNLGGNSLLANPEGIEEIARQGVGAMPPVAQGWTEEEMDALTGYLRDVVAKQGGGGSGDSE